MLANAFFDSLFLGKQFFANIQGWTEADHNLFKLVADADVFLQEEEATYFDASCVCAIKKTLPEECFVLFFFSLPDVVAPKKMTPWRLVQINVTDLLFFSKTLTKY